MVRVKLSFCFKNFAQTLHLLRHHPAFWFVLRKFGTQFQEFEDSSPHISMFLMKYALVFPFSKQEDLNIAHIQAAFFPLLFLFEFFLPSTADKVDHG
jgi:hypothetical protein